MKTLLEYFKDIAAIPHLSGCEGALADYVVGFAKEQGLFYTRDAMHNIVIKKPANPGYEQSPVVLLQGHLDMVGAKRDDIEHDFLTQPLELIETDGILRANGTTLGGDDGVAVAYMLALLADNTFGHPALECVFTVQEETGLFGAQALDTSQLQGQRMINLDAGPEGIFLSSCAGGCRVYLSRPLTREAFVGQGWQIDIFGLKSGHSGVDMQEERGNALVLMGYLLDRLSSLSPRIVSIEGGVKDNVIPPSAKMIVMTTEDPSSIIKETIGMIQDAWSVSDPDLSIAFRPVPVAYRLCEADSKAIADLLLLLPNGVASLSAAMVGSIESSANLAVIQTGEVLDIHLSLRSSSDTRKAMLLGKIERLATMMGATVRTDGEYPGWRFEPESVLREKAVQVYVELFGKQPKVEGIHAGLECGVFKGKMPHLDIIAIGPAYGGMHTPEEWLDIASFERYYQFLKKLLEGLQ